MSPRSPMPGSGGWSSPGEAAPLQSDAQLPPSPRRCGLRSSPARTTTPTAVAVGGGDVALVRRPRRSGSPTSPMGLRRCRRRPGRPRRAARARSGRLHRGRLRLLGERGRRRRRRPGPRTRRASPRAAERGATLAARHAQDAGRRPGVALGARGTPARDREPGRSAGEAVRRRSSGSRRTATLLRRSCSRPVRRGRPRASSTTSAGWEPSSPPCASATPIGPDDRLVAAFAPFALYGPALGIPVAVPDCDITKPASLSAEALADACAAVGATILFAAPAALDGVLASRQGLSTAGSAKRSAALRLVLSAGAPVPQRDPRGVRRPGAPAPSCTRPTG